MPSCVVKSCKNNRRNSNKSVGITFHMFPSVESAAKDSWLAAIRHSRNDPHWIPTKGSVVCSDHFMDDDLYITDKGFRRVTRSGYPKKNLTPDTENKVFTHLAEVTIFPQSMSSMPPDNVDTDSSNSQDHTDTVVDASLKKAPLTTTFVPTNATIVNDWNRIFLTPRSEKLQNNITRQKKGIKQAKMKIKAMQHVVKQLKLQNKYLKDILKNKKASLLL
ncbi:hypothetical protein O0L34_g3914 [Tuta absoluta]|nr:hypothetical protein O0L34_g3914 [Tuta absoluta]